MGNFKDGVLTLKKLAYADVKVHLIPKTNTRARPGTKLDMDGITIHNTGNRKAGATAHTKYVDVQKNYVSWHFTVDDKFIYQELPVTERAWHAGDGREGFGNARTIAIEICEHDGIDWNKAKLNAARLIDILCEEFGRDAGCVYPHKHWSSKYCPRKILDEGWTEFYHFLMAAPWARESWLKAADKRINDGRNPEHQVTEQQLMVFLDRVGLLD